MWQAPVWIILYVYANTCVLAYYDWWHTAGQLWAACWFRQCEIRLESCHLSVCSIVRIWQIRCVCASRPWAVWEHQYACLVFVCVWKPCKWVITWTIGCSVNMSIKHCGRCRSKGSALITVGCECTCDLRGLVCAVWCDLLGQQWWPCFWPYAAEVELLGGEQIDSYCC